VDLNVPITNEKLVAAIRKHQKSGSNQTAVELFEELKKAVFLVGAILEKPRNRSTSNQTLFKKGEKIGVVEVHDAKDARLLAVFTDHPELQHFTNQANSTFVMPTK